MARALAALLAVLLLAAPASAANLKAGTFDPPRVAPEFKLRGSDGTDLTLGRFKGKVVVLAFGFTSCPDVCPVTLATLASARKKLGADAADVQIVYVTVDPARDDVARMRDYLKTFDPTFVGGTGTDDELKKVRTEFGIAASRTDTGFSHSSYTYLIDRAGSLRALMPYGNSADDYAHDLRILLAK